MTKQEEQSNTEYVEFVLKTIADYRKYTDKLTSDVHEVFPQDVQYILANYQSVKLGLLSEKHRRLNYFRQLKRQFTAWWNTKVSDARRELIASQKAGAKFPAVKDYTLQAEEANKDEYVVWQDKIQDAEDKYVFMDDLKKDWDDFQKILYSLNSNMTSELRSLSIDRMSAPKVRQKRED